MKKHKHNRRLLALLLILAMLAAEFSAAGIPALASENPYISINGWEETDGFYVSLYCSNFNDIANFSMQITYDPAILRFISFEQDSLLDNALVSVNANNGTLSIAFVSDTDIYCNYRDLIKLRFELLNPEPTYTELHCTIVECTDSMLNSKSVFCNEYNGYYVKNDATTNYELSFWSEYNVALFSDAAFHFGFHKNGGFYAGSMTLTYDATQMEFVGYEFAQDDLGMTLTFTDMGDETNGKIRIAFAGTQLYTDTGNFLELIFVPKVSGWCWARVDELVLTGGNLQEVYFSSDVSSSVYASDTKASNYFSISNPDSIVTGDTFDVVIDLNNNSGYAALTGSLLYDSDLFEFVSAELNADTIGSAMSSVSGLTPGEVRFAIVSGSSITGNGELLTVTFKAIAHQEERTHLELDIIELVDQLAVPLSYATDIGRIFVSPTHIHKWEEAGYVEPTCTEQGYTVYTCNLCGDTYHDNFQDAWGHDLGYCSGQLPTCTDPGWNDYAFCWRCNYTTYVEIPASGHSYEDTVIAPTCYSDGYTTHTCTACGDWYTDSYVAASHSYNSVVTEPTCYSEGYTTHTCTVCGDWYTDSYVSTTEHTMGEAVIENESPATCTSDGYCDTVYYCTECGCEISREWTITPAFGHSYDSVVTDPTCFEDGYTTHTCTVCGDWYVDSYVASSGHTAGEAVIENEFPATCTTDGSCDTVFYCIKCGHEISREPTVIPASGHSHEAVVTAPTCTAKGFTTYTCHCGDSYVSDYVAATGHHYEDGICKDCGQEEPDGLLGDVSNDGKINARDARALLRYIAGLINESELNLTVADFNGDGSINARDARALLRFIAGLD